MEEEVEKIETELINSELELIDKTIISEPKRCADKKQKWKDEEIIKLFESIKKHNLLSRNLTDRQLGESLVDPMSKSGFKRTPQQIRLKMTSLRQKYFKIINSRFSEKSLENCPFFDLLDSVYNDKNLATGDTSGKKLNSYDGDIEVGWVKEELETMLSYIIEMNLKSEITLHSFSLKALRQISEALKEKGYDKNVEQVETVLHSLKSTFIKFKRDYKIEQSIKDFPHYLYLNKMWSAEYENTQSESRPSNQLKDTEFWSDEETVLLLNSIKKLDIINEAFHNSEESAEKLLLVLNGNGYKRTKSQLQNKMENLMNNYIEGKRLDNEKEALKKFPMLFIYDNIFGSYFEKFDFKSFGQVESDHEQQIKQALKSPPWSFQEIKTLLNLIIELNLAPAFRERLKKNGLDKLVEEMKRLNYSRTSVQISVKMRTLKMLYMRCIEAGCTPQAINECQFYNQLNDIFKESKVSPEITVLPSKNDKVFWQPIETIKDLDGNISDNEAEEEYEEEEIQRKECVIQKVQKSQNNSSGPDLFRKQSSSMQDTIEEHKMPKFKEVLIKVKEEIDDDDIEVINMGTKEDTVYSNFLDNQNSHENLNNVETVECNQNFEEVIDDHSSFEEVANSSVKSLMSSKKNSKTIPTENGMEKSSIGYYKKITVKIPGKSTLKRKSSVEIMPEVSTHKRRLNNEEPNSIIDLEDVSEDESLSNLISKILENESKMQKQHQEWLEKQFKIQRDHDREQRSILLNELKEFRLAITSVMNKKSNTRR